MSSTYGKTWDGKSRPVDETYRQNYDEIFGSKRGPEKVKEQHTDPEQDLLLMEEQLRWMEQENKKEAQAAKKKSKKKKAKDKKKK